MIEIYKLGKIKPIPFAPVEEGIGFISTLSGLFKIQHLPRF